MLTEIEKEFIKDYASKKTVKELSEITGATKKYIYNFCYNNNLKFKKEVDNKWSYSEIEYLKENYGTIPIPTIAKRLGRSINSIICKKERLKLGSFTSNAEDYITLYQLSKVIGIDIKYTNRLKAHKFPFKKKLIKTKSINIVYIDEFLKWLEIDNNKHLVDFSNMEKGDIFAVEPAWFEEKRIADRKHKRFKTTKWTEEENKRLIALCNEFKYGYKEISYKLNRLESAIKKQLTNLGVKVRPLRVESSHISWTSDEISIVKKMYKVGYKPDVIKDFLHGRSALAIQGLLERYNYFLERK